MARKYEMKRRAERQEGDPPQDHRGGCGDAPVARPCQHHHQRHSRAGRGAAAHRLQAFP